jgi:predicted nucleic acid-binding protein
MIVLDTNVLSALMLVLPEAKVADWLDRQPSTSIWTTSVTVFEIRSGLETMPLGRRRSRKVGAFERLLAEVIEQRIAAFDSTSAGRAAEIFAAGQKNGRPVEMRDAMIAGIVLANHATLATRNVRHFEDIAKSVVNPWE